MIFEQKADESIGYEIECENCGSHDISHVACHGWEELICLDCGHFYQKRGESIDRNSTELLDYIGKRGFF